MRTIDEIKKEALKRFNFLDNPISQYEIDAFVEGAKYALGIEKTIEEIEADRKYQLKLEIISRMTEFDTRKRNDGIYDDTNFKKPTK